jgi:hypothetical protein
VTYRFGFDLRSGALVHSEYDNDASGAAPLLAFGGLGATCTERETPKLRDLTSAATLHKLRRAGAELLYGAGRHTPQAHRGGMWSADGRLLAMWAPVTDGGTEAEVHIFRIPAIDEHEVPPAGELAPLHTLHVPHRVGAAAFSADGAWLYTVVQLEGFSGGVLHAWELARGAQLAQAELPYEGAPRVILRPHSLPPGVLLVSMHDELFLAIGDDMRVQARSAQTLALVGELATPPLRGGHGTPIKCMCAVGDVLLTLDAGGCLLAWHAPSRQLLRRMGRNAFAATPARDVQPGSLTVTRRGVAWLEFCHGERSHTRLLAWLPV